MLIKQWDAHIKKIGRDPARRATWDMSPDDATNAMLADFLKGLLVEYDLSTFDMGEQPMGSEEIVDHQDERPLKIITVGNNSTITPGYTSDKTPWGTEVQEPPKPFTAETTAPAPVDPYEMPIDETAIGPEGDDGWNTVISPDDVLVADPATGAMKADGAKNRLDLLPFIAIEQVGMVMTFGAAKYSAHNWRKGFNWTRLTGSTLRHLFAWLGGEELDKDSGLNHIAHCATNILFLLEMILTNTGNDDRYTY
jgi:hypothetical protein